MSETVSSRSTLIISAIVIIVIVIGSGILLFSRPDAVQITINPPLPTETPVPTNTPSPILIYVTGAVNEPQQTITLPFASRVSDAIDAVGGFAGDADMTRVNLAGIVRDGDQIHVPSVNDSLDNTEISTLPTPSGGAVIYINSATVEELETLPGVGPTTAQRIIEYREENGAFTSLEDLDNVSGIGPAMLEAVADLVSFE
ncbi:MAG: helix-hairpin-helix domain-containing protein [Anaerolineae bacterium]|nr:helix-hairpin-helix domain-containing protein [Anaerolineae bacterium]MDQ7036066.1 helix-hairpin-helix domain-containing protein [Anaerolineae bacterium]